MFKSIDKSWTLFLDRDGVINHEKKDDYIYNKDEFFFYEGVLEALSKLSNRFATIVIVTNQKGIGKGLMTVDDLNGIHEHMLSHIKKAGGRIDGVFFAPDLDNDAINRKPNPGMAFQAKKKFSTIDFSKSIMVGNKLSDMKFARNAGIYAAFVATTHPQTPFPNPLIDLRFDDLSVFADFIETVYRS